MASVEQVYGAKLAKLDAAVLEHLKSIDSPGERGPYSDPSGQGPSTSFSEPGTHAADPRLYARHLIRLGTQLKASGIAAHAATQTALMAMNRYGRVWNPAAFAAAPLVSEHLPPSLDMLALTPFVDTKPGFYEQVEDPRLGGRDRHRQLNRGTFSDSVTLGNIPFVKREVKVGAVGPQNVANNAPPRLVGAASQDTSLVDDVYSQAYAGQAIVDVALRTRNLYGTGQGAYDTGLNDDGSRTHDGLATFRVGDLVDAALLDAKEVKADQAQGAAEGRRHLDVVQTPGAPSRSRFNVLKASFDPPRNASLEFKPKYPATAGPRAGVDVSEDPVAASSFADGVIPMSFRGEEEFTSFIQTEVGKSPTTVIDDDEAYVPLSFTDLRPYGNKVRTVYFRPIITNLSEELSPEWNKANFWNRVDPVATYQSTTRTINLGFQLHAFSPEDVPVIYRKLTWLASMVYPEYDKDLIFKAGPVVRMRVGDVIKSGEQGLPGIIDSLASDYSDALWELKKGFKVPRSVNVSLAFTVLHDVPIGRGLDGKFGGIGFVDKDGRYRRFETLTPTNGGQDNELRDAEVRSSLPFRGFAEVDGYADVKKRTT